MVEHNVKTQKEAWPILKDDTRPSIGWYFQGNSVVTCKRCGSQFVGDKHSLRCADCEWGSREGKWLARASRRRNQW